MANEKRLIWDEDAKRRIIALATGFHTDRLPVDMVVNVILHQAPTVDAVEVVYCGSCRHASDECDNGWLWCGKWNEGSECGGYCHKGERKDNGK